MISEDKVCTYATLGISAPRMYWLALGFSVSSDTDEVGYCTTYNVNELLCLGVAATGAKDERAVAWALGERQRRKEFATSTGAQQDEAKAIAELAQAIRDNTDQAFLDRLLPRLTEKLRYAIQQQLKNSY